MTSGPAGGAAPRVSVTIPVRNRPAMVTEAIRSILAQDFRDFELIVADDGSDDGTPEAVRAIPDPRIRLLALPSWCGQAGVRNMAIRAARGEYIAAMDSDDIAFPGRLGAQVAAMDADPALDVLGTAVRRRRRDGTTNIASPPRDDGTFKARLFMLDTAFFHPTLMFRRTTLERTGVLYSEDQPSCSDYMLLTRLMEAGARFANLAEPLLEYRIHPESLSRTNPTHEENKAEIRRRLLGLFFPGLTHGETAAIATVMRFGRPYGRLDACRAIAAAEKALGDRTSHFGEDRAHLAELVESVLRTLLRQLAASARPAEAISES